MYLTRAHKPLLFSHAKRQLQSLGIILQVNSTALFCNIESEHAHKWTGNILLLDIFWDDSDCADDTDTHRFLKIRQSNASLSQPQPARTFPGPQLTGQKSGEYLSCRTSFFIPLRHHPSCRSATAMCDSRYYLLNMMGDKYQGSTARRLPIFWIASSSPPCPISSPATWFIQNKQLGSGISALASSVFCCSPLERILNGLLAIPANPKNSSNISALQFVFKGRNLIKTDSCEPPDSTISVTGICVWSIFFISELAFPICRRSSPQVGLAEPASKHLRFSF